MPLVTVAAVAQVVPLVDVWTRNALPYAPSHRSVTLQTLCDEPRSTCHHCASANVLDQRVPRLPSTAALAGVPPFSVVDAVAVLPCATLAVPQVPAPSGWASVSA